MGRMRFVGMGVVLAGTLAAFVANAAVPVRRIAAVDDTERARVTDNVSPRLATAARLGAVAADKQLTSITLGFSLTSAQQSSLTALLGDLQDPASPRYHAWLTPEQFRAQFGMSDNDLAQVKAWLQSEGLTVTEVGRGGQFVRFSGTAAQVETAFQTSIERVTVNGEEHFANTSAPSLPKAIAEVTTSVTGLDDFHPTAHSILRTGAPQSSPLHPEYTGSSGSHYLAPGDLYTIYDVAGLISSNINGTGVKIAVVGQADVTLANVAAFRTASGLSANAPTVQLYGSDPGTSVSGDVVESTVDLEWAGALAPSATVLFVTSTDVLDGSLTEAVDNDLAPIVSMSYGDCEADLGTSLLAHYDVLLQQGAAEGITIVGAGGDAGASDCDYQTNTAKHGYGVDFPGSSPYVTSVGGTELNEGTGSYWNSTNGAYAGSAKSYIPEVVWNDDTYGTLQAGGGGASAYFVKPSWQTGTGVPADTARDVPDVAMPASPDHDPYLICTTGFCSTGYYSSGGYPATIGGTSVAAPVFAGILALVEQKAGLLNGCVSCTALGVVNNKIYALAKSSYAGNVFHDITSGNNNSPCTTGTTDCPAGVAFGFTAGGGYDQASGWGSVDAGNFVNDWALVTVTATMPAGITPTIVNLSGSSSSVLVGTADTLTVTVASALASVTSTPTGTVQFTVDGAYVGSAVTLSAGTATYSLSTTALSVGTHKVRAAYSGDATFLGSLAVFTLTVGSSTQPDFTLTPGTASLTAASGTSSPALTLTVAPLNGFTGAVTFSVSAGSTSAAITPVLSATSVTISGTSSATTTFTLLAFQPEAAKGKVTTAGWANPTWMRLGGGVFLAGMLLLLAPKRRNIGALLLVLAAAGTFGITGCGDSSTPTVPPQVNANPGTYTYTVFATGTVSGSSVTHSSVVTFIVN